MSEYRYFKGSRDTYEAVEFDIMSKGQYITTCSVNIYLLSAGIVDFPCGNGNDISLTLEEQLDILEFVQTEREKILEKEGVRSLDGWRNSGLTTWEDYCKPGDIVREDIVDHFVNILPPTTLEYGYVQAGEAHNTEKDDDGRYRNTYITFTHHGKDDAGGYLWLHNGYCFKKGTDNRVDIKTSVQRRIDTIREQM